MSCKSIKKQLVKTPFLIITPEGDVRLATHAETFKEMMSRETALIVNCKQAFATFMTLDLVKPDAMFTRFQIADIAGCDPQQVYEFGVEGVLVPTIRATGRGRSGSAWYDLDAAFCAGLIGLLKRHRCHMDILAKIQPLFAQNDIAVSAD